MIRRVLSALFACALAAHASADTYLRYQAFSDGPPKNWRYFHPNQGFGFFPTNANGAGNAGGFFFPKTYTAYYADTSLNGAFNRSVPLSASGRITLQELSFDPNYTNTAYIAHFRKGSTKDKFVNIVGISLTGNNHGDILAAPIVQFSNGKAFAGSSIKLPVTATVMNWSYDFDPTGGAQSLGLLTVTIDKATTTLTLGRLSGGIDYVIDSFGLYQPAFAAPNSNSFFSFFVDELGYTAFQGPAPKIKVKGPKNITTSLASVPFAGTTKAATGNRVTAVRYRIMRGSKDGSYKKARGISNWSANVAVPPGASTIEFKAVGDNGRSGLKQVKITRVP